GVSVPLALLKQREQHAQRIWVVQMGSWQNPARYLSSGFQLRHAWQLDHGYLHIWLYQREPPAAPARSAARPQDQVSGDLAAAPPRAAPRIAPGPLPSITAPSMDPATPSPAGPARQAADAGPGGSADRRAGRCRGFRRWCASGSGSATRSLA